MFKIFTKIIYHIQSCDRIVLYPFRLLSRLVDELQDGFFDAQIRKDV